MNFKKSLLSLAKSNLPDEEVKALLREMLCKSGGSDCDGVNRFFTQPYKVGDVIEPMNRWYS